MVLRTKTIEYAFSSVRTDAANGYEWISIGGTAHDLVEA